MKHMFSATRKDRINLRRAGRQQPFRCARLAAVLAAVSMTVLAGCASTDGPASSEMGTPTVEEQFGVKIEGVRLTANGYMLDFRFRILDSDLAAPLLDRSHKPELIDLETGGRFTVPTAPKVGMLRTSLSSGKPKQGRVYFMMFANPGGVLKSGSRVSVVVGEFVSDPIIVQ